MSVTAHSVESVAIAGAVQGKPIGSRRHVIGRTAKRGVDLLLAPLLVLFSLPLLGVIALLVAMDGGPVLYRHRRIGLRGRPFDCLKFRSMIIDADQCLAEYLAYHPGAAAEWRQGQKLAFDPRVTPIGNLLRRLSFDELPQLFNVIGGSMSLVGPRPVTQRELDERYGPHAADYLSVRPGITGLWQVSGRSEVDYARRVQLDVEYVARWSLWRDLWILLRTWRVVLSRAGAR